MAAMQKEAGSVTSRDFSSTGWCGEALDFMTRAPGAGGGGWALYDDQRAAGSNPYVVLCNQSSPTWYSKAKYMQIQFSTASELVWITYWLGWNNSTHTGIYGWHRGTLATVTGSFAYDFRAGTEFVLLGSRVGTSRYWTFVDEWTRIPIFCEPETATGTIISNAFTETGDTNNQVSRYYNLTGYKALLDASGNLYFNAVYSGGNLQVNVYSNSARTNLIGHTSNSNATGTRNITADGASGLGGSINVDAIGTSSNLNIACRFLRLELNSGEGANFVSGESYFIWYLTGTPNISYFKVENIVGDVLIVDQLPAFDYLPGSIVDAYPHRIYCESSQYGNTTNYGLFGSLPYHCSSGYEWVNRGLANTPFEQGASTRLYSAVGSDMQPDHKERYLCSPMVVFEATQGNGSPGVFRKRNFGVLKNVKMTSNVGLQDWLDGRTINGNQWLAFQTSSNLTRIARHWTSLS